MKKTIPLLVLAFLRSPILANPESEKAAAKAEKSLKMANAALKAALRAYRANALPESRAAIAADQLVWRGRVEKECSPKQRKRGEFRLGSAIRVCAKRSVRSRCGNDLSKETKRCSASSVISPQLVQPPTLTTCKRQTSHC